MALPSKRIGPLALRLLAVFMLLSCPRMGSAAGTWSVISLPQSPGEVESPTVLAVDASGSLYVADEPDAGGRIQKRDAQGIWSVIAPTGSDLGQVNSPTALAVDAAGNLYVADEDSYGPRIQKRDAQGNWSVLAKRGDASGLLYHPTGLAVDAAGNLYVEQTDVFECITCSVHRILKGDVQGNWAIFDANHSGLLAVDAAVNLYVAAGDQILKRDAQGNWSVVTVDAVSISALAVNAAGNLYVAEDDDSGTGQILKRDVQGNWSIIATVGTETGQVSNPAGLAVDAAGHLYVADTGNDRVQVYTPDGP